MRSPLFSLCCVIFALILARIEARCMNWCSKNGICTDPGDAGFCICNHGYTGQDCSQRMCPKAFDPVVTDENTPRRTIQLTVGRESGVLEGRVELFFNNASIWLDANTDNLSSEECTTQVSKMKGVTRAICKNERKGDEKTSEYKYTITFLEWSLQPFENNIFFHDGNPSLDAFMCNVKHVNEFMAVNPYCRVTDVVTEGSAAYLECGNHGECDHRTGKCECEHGFHGVSCSKTDDNNDEHTITHDGPFFTGTVLKTAGIRSSSPHFNFFQIIHMQDKYADPFPVTTVRGDNLLMHNGNAEINGGLVATLPLQKSDFTSVLKLDKKHSVDINEHPAVMLKSYTTRDDDFHMQLHGGSYQVDPATNKKEYVTKSVLNVTSNGDIHTSGSIRALDGEFSVEGGLVTAQSINVVNSLDVHGSAVVEDSLTIGSGFALTPEGMTIDTNKHSGPLLELRSGQDMFNGSLLEINAVAGSNSSMIRTVVDGLTTFDLTTAGNLTLASLRMLSGGIAVEAGGLHIDAGGLTVKGGLTVESGNINLGDSTFFAPSIYVKSDIQSNLLVVESSSKDFAGTALLLKGKGDSSNTFNMMSAEIGDKEIFSIKSDGTVQVDGDLKVGRNIDVQKHARLNGGLSVAKTSIKAGDSIRVPADAVFVEVVDDGAVSANVLHMPVRNDGCYEGQIMIIRNNDASPLQLMSKGLKINVGTTALFLFDGSEWRDLHALSVQLDKLAGIKSFEIVDDIYIGNYTLEAGGFKLSSLKRGEVLVGGVGGVLRGRQGLTYRSGVLTTPSLNVATLAADVDAKSKTISNAILSKAWIIDGKIQAQSVSVEGQSGIAFFDQKGNLKGSSTVKMTEDGELIVSDFYIDVDMHSSQLKNVSSIAVKEIVDVESAIVKKLFLADTTVSTGSIAHVGANGEVVFNDALSFRNGILQAADIGPHKQSGNVNYDGNQLVGAMIVGGSATELAEVITKSLKIDPLPTNSDVDNVAIVKSDGLIVRDDGSSKVSVGSLTVNSLKVTASLDMDGSMLQDAVLSKPRLSSASENRGGSTKASMVGMDSSTGEMIGIQDIEFAEGELKTKVLSAENVKAGSLLLTSVKGESLLSTDSAGNVIPATFVKTDSVISSTLDVSDTASVASLQLKGVSVPGILTVDDTGFVKSSSSVALIDLSVSGSAIASSLSVDELIVSKSTGGYLSADSSGRVSTSTAISAKSVVADSGVFDEVEVKSLSFSGGMASAILSLTADGKLTPSNEAAVTKLTAEQADVTGSLSVGEITVKSFEGSKGVAIVDEKGKLFSANGITIASVSSETLSVTGHTQVGALSISDLTDEGILSVDKKGTVLSSRDINVQTVVAEKLNAEKGSFDSLTLNGLTSTVLAVNAQGTVTGVSDLELNYVKSLSVASGKGSFDTLHINAVDGGGMLKVDANGQIIRTSGVEGATLDVSGHAKVQGTMTLSSLNWAGNVDKTSKSSLLVVDSATGQVSPQSSVSAENIEAGHIQGAIIQADEFKMAGGKSAAILAVSQEGKIVSSDDTLIPNLSIGGITVSGEGKFGAVKLENIAAGAPLTVDETGKVGTNKQIRLQGFTAHDGVVSSLTVQSDFILSSVVSEHGDGSAPLVADKNGKISSSQSLKLSKATLDTISVNGVSDLSGIKLPLKNVLLSTDADGVVVHTEHVRVETIDANDSHVSNMELKHLKLTGVGKGLLHIDANEAVRTMDGFHYDSAKSAMVVKNLQLSEVRGGFLIATDKGDVSSVSSLDLPSLSAESITATSSLSTPKLILKGSVSSLLSTDAYGNVVPATSINTDSLSSSTLDVTGKASVGSLRVSELKSTVLFADATGTIVSARDTSLGSIEADSISVSRVQIKGVSEGGVLTADGSGTVKLSSSMDLKKLSTTDMSVTGEANINKLVTGSLSLKATASNSGISELLVIDSAGNVAPTSKLAKVSADTGDFKDITAKTVAATSFQFVAGETSSLVDDTLLAVGKGGYIKTASDAKVATLSVTSQLTVEGKLSLGKLKLREVKSAVLGASASGDLVPVNGASLSADGSIVLNSVTISSLGGDISLQGNKLVDGVIVASKIKESDIYLNPKVPTAGALAVVDMETGMLGKSEATVSKSGEIKVTSIGHIEKGKSLTVLNALLDAAVLTNAEVNAKNVKTATMSVSGSAEFGSDVFVDGSVNVRGTVIGSGPYIDSSDKRFKSNVTRLTNALEQVMAMTGVAYNFKVDEFPNRKFDSSRQIGWIADEMADIIPEIVKEDSEGFKYIAYSHAAPILGEAIKQLKEETDIKTNVLASKASDDHEVLLTLRNTVSAMENEMKKLAEENKRLQSMLNDVLLKLQ